MTCGPAAHDRHRPMCRQTVMGFHVRWNGDFPSLIEADGGNDSVRGAIVDAFLQLAAEVPPDKIEFDVELKQIRGLQALLPDDGEDVEDENGA